MKVTKIKRTPSGKYKLIFDDQTNVTTYDDVILKNNLLYQQNIDSDTLNKVNIDTKYFDSYSKVVKYITFRLRSKKEIDDYCDKLDLLPEEKKAIMEALTKMGLINDNQFTKAFIADKIRFSSLGPYRIKQELLLHDIDNDTIDNYLLLIDIKEIKDKINKHINKKIKSNNKYSNYLLRQKLYGELTELGFDSIMINDCLNELLTGSNSKALEKEYYKIYNSLQRKYTGEELNYRLKNKLYQKGFSLEEINSFLSSL